MAQKNVIIALIILTITFFTFATFSGVFKPDKEENSAAEANWKNTANAEGENNGKISGSLTYPSSSIPGSLIVCAENADSGEEVACSDQQLQDDKKFIYGKGYELSLPEGKYYVYAKQDGNKAFYNGYMAEVSKDKDWPDYYADLCKDKYQPTLVEVVSGAETAGITVGDWYFETNCNQ